MSPAEYPTSPSVPQSGGGKLRAPRIYYVHPLLIGDLADWDAIFDHAAAIGFDTVLIAPPFVPGRARSILLPQNMKQLHPALGEADAVSGLARLSEKARMSGLSLMLDVVLDRVAGDSSFAQEIGLAAANVSGLDPRQDPADRDAIIVPFDESDPAGNRYLRTLSERLSVFAAEGLAGVRCLHWDRVPSGPLRHLTASVRGSARDFRFLAWTPGTTSEVIRAGGSADFDGTFSSLAWWDMRQSWIADEHELQRSVGVTIAFPEAPFDKRLAGELESREIIERRARRALRLTGTVADGFLMPMGYEFGSRERLDPARGHPVTLQGLREQGDLDLTGEVKFVNGLDNKDGACFSRKPSCLVVSDASPIAAIVRIDAEDARQAERSRIVLVNADLRRAAKVTGSFIASKAGSTFFPYREEDPAGLGLRDHAIDALYPASTLVLQPGEVRVLAGKAQPRIQAVAVVAEVEQAVTAPRMIIEKVTPSVDDGAFPVKREVGQVVVVEADIFCDGHDPIAAVLKWRAADEPTWQEVTMHLLANDRWTGEFSLERVGRYEFLVEAWRDPFRIFRYELDKKYAAGLDVTLELEEGRILVESAASNADAEVASLVRPIAERLAHATYDSRLQILLSTDTLAAMIAADRRPFRTSSAVMPLDAERTAVGFSSWYTLFPRSMSGDPGRHGTFDDVITRLPAIRGMGFDVLYMTPIHPIGRTHRKGKNNSLSAGPGDPGSPYATGSEAGGHDAIHPELGTFEDLRRLIHAAGEHGMEVAMDIAIQASPDHPWLKKHPDWFDWRPDGTIRYAENPPKKYEDIVNVDFYAKGAMPSLWLELRDVILLWVEQGVKLFRIDNPHTKPFPFWEWLIADIRRDHPDVAFLAEAFTRPKVMYRLAKIGFSQSYTYFTWRNTKYELTEYLTELTQEAPRDFFRPHFFVNTPDINPDFLQDAPRSAYLIRAALAATLSGLWGIYSGFELCEGRPDVKKKEYADSEKYEIRAWDWDRPGNIIDEISQLNRIRKDNPALHSHLGIDFLPAGNENILFFEKASPGRENVLLIAVSLDPHGAQETDIEIPLWKFGLPDDGTLEVEDLMRRQRFAWAGKYQHIRCDPAALPFSIWRVSSRTAINA